MLIIGENQVIQNLYQSDTTIIYRAKNMKTGQPVILKVLAPTNPTTAQKEKFTQEFHIMSSFSSDKIIQPYRLEKHNDTLLIEMEDFYGQPLSHLIDSNKLKIGWFLETAIHLTDILNTVHKKDIIHKDFTPANILVNSTTGQFKLIDFSISEYNTATNDVTTALLEGNLPYIAPEQTGRIDREIDHRTDLYTLGVTLFQLLTGSFPFQTEDPMETIHFHIAKKPPPAHKIHNSIPVAVSLIIAKLLEKSSENRYQSCNGLRADLSTALEMLKNSSTIVPFVLGQQDSTVSLSFPTNLIGCEDEISKGLNFLSQQSSHKLLLISGEKGCGKTAFLKVIAQFIQEQGGSFVAARFYEHLGTTTVFGPIIKALQYFVQQILISNQNKIETFKSSLIYELGSEIKLVNDILPEIEHLIGKQPHLPSLSPKETVARFNRVIAGFLKAASTVGTPFVLALDDIQWADPPTLSLLQSIASNDMLDGLKIIFTCELDTPTKPRREKIRTICSPDQFTELTLSHFSISQVIEFLTLTLSMPEKKVAQLGEICHQKTAGSPYFLRSFLLNLHKKKLLFNDGENWQWVKESIEQEIITANRVSRLLQSLPSLPKDQLHILQVGSCIKSQFTEKDILSLTGKDTSHHLTAVREMGFFISLTRSDKTNTHQLSFSHPLIRSAIYKDMSIEEQQNHHFIIGRNILNNPPGQTSENAVLIAVADQLNAADNLVKNESERMELANINLEASKSLDNNHIKSLNFINHSIQLLTDSSWITHSDFTLQVYQRASELSLQCGKNLETIQYSEIILSNSQNHLEKLRALLHRVYAQKALNLPGEAVTTALNGLEMLGITFPKNPGKIKLALTFLQIHAFTLFKDTKIPTKHITTLSNEEQKLATNFLLEISPIVYSGFPHLLPFISWEALTLTMEKRDTSEAAALGYALFAFIQCSSRFGSISKGIQLGSMAMKIHQQINNNTAVQLTPFLITNFLLHWNTHLHEGLPKLNIILDEAVSNNHRDIATSAANAISYRLLHLGKNLKEASVELAKHRRMLDSSGQQPLIYRQMIYQQAVENLLGNNADPAIFDGSYYNENKIANIHRQNNDQTTLFQLHLTKLINCFIFQNFDQAINSTYLAEQYVGAAIGSIHLPVFYFYDALVRLALIHEQTEINRELHLKKIKINLVMLKRWSKSAPMNYQHMVLLIQGELHRVNKDKAKAVETYEEALKHLKSQNFLREEAVILERIVNFYDEIGKTFLAKIYIEEARSCYQRWGAVAKVSQLDKQAGVSPSTRPNSEQPGSIELHFETQFPKTKFDMMTIIKASRTLTGEIVLDELLKKTLSIMIENAGAQKGFLIFNINGKWIVRAKGSIVDTDANIQVLSTPIESQKDELSESIINHISRTGETVVLNDAATKGGFTQDRYIKNFKPQSILCTPIIHKGEISCILYLENNLTTRAFPPERQEILNILGTQAAISLENSSLYADIDSTVTQLHKEIVKRKETQKQLLHAEKLTALGRLSASIAHEFGNPLMGIKYLLDDFQSRTDLSQSDQELLRIGLEECNRMRKLMKDLHQLDKPSTGLAIEFDLHHCIDNVLLFQGKFFTSKNIVIEKLYPQEPLPIIAVEDQIIQVLINLIMNGVDSIPENRDGIITITTQKNDQTIELTISDNGVGIPNSNIEKIFEPFYSTKPEVEGTGLGLPTSYGIITKHGGDITCTSIPEQGTNFIITLPKNPNSQNPTVHQVH